MSRKGNSDVKRLRLDGGTIQNWDDFHDQCTDRFGFPDFYGRNMDAWIDCLTSLDAPDDGMTTIHVEPGEVLVLEIDNARELKQSCPDVFAAIVECAAFVNDRRVKRERPAVIALSFHA